MFIQIQVFTMYRHVVHCLLIVYGIFIFSLHVNSTHLNTFLQCMVDSPSCDASRRISESDETITMDAFLSCGNCVLHVNTTEHYGITLDITRLTSWSQSHHLYVKYEANIFGFTGVSSSCGMSFPTNALAIHFRASASLGIQANMIPNGHCPDDTDASNCSAITDCDNVFSFSDIWEVVYSEANAYFDSDYVHPNIFNLYGNSDFSASLPKCSANCVCHLDYQRLIHQCENETNMQTLIIHQSPANSKLNKFLDASNRQIENITTKAFQDLRYVNRLSLNRNMLTHIEPGTFGWSNLRMIELGENKLTNLPSDIFNGLYFLFVLDLHGNQLTSLPPRLFRYSQLSLVALELSRNNMAELSPEINDLVNLLVLILDKNNLTTLQPGTFKRLAKLWWLYLDDNNLTTISPDTFTGLYRLYRLHLSGNYLTTLEPDMFKGAETLKELTLNRNGITELAPGLFHRLSGLFLLSLDDNKLYGLDLQPFEDLHRLIALYISGNRLLTIKHGLSELNTPMLFAADGNNETNVTSAFPRLKVLQLDNNTIQMIEGDIFREMPTIEALQIRGNPLHQVDRSTFSMLDNTTFVLVDDPSTCCFITGAQCKAINPRQPYLTCLRLLPHPSIRTFMWIFGLCAFVGNVSVLIWRCLKHGEENIIQVLLIENLAASDLLMGVYMLIIASADTHYQQYFPSFSDNWRNGGACKFAGTLSVVSSEGSVFFITLISIDRFLAIKYPRGKQRLTKKSATIALIGLWALAILLSVISTSVSGLNPDFYDVSEVCIGLPFVRSPVFLNKTVVALDLDFDDYDSISSAKDGLLEEEYIYPENSNSPGLYFSIVLFLGINLLCLFVVVICYIYIFVLYKQSTRKAGKSSSDEEITLAIRMGAIVLTDFMCWMPIIIIGILVQSAVVTISPVIYVYIVVFILPINSAVNPYIYTAATILSRRRKTAKAKAQQKKKTANSANKRIVATKSSETGTTSV